MRSVRQPTGDHHKYTSDALRTARETVLDGDELRRSYARPVGVPRLIVLITRGPSDDPRTAAIEALNTRDHGVDVFVVGLGPLVSMEEVENIASHPWKNFTFLIDDARGLDSAAIRLAASVCNRKSIS